MPNKIHHRATFFGKSDLFGFAITRHLFVFFLLLMFLFFLLVFALEWGVRAAEAQGREKKPA